MEIILKEDIQGLGYRNDTIVVKPGYGRNYLIPKGLAMIANKTNVKRISEEIRQSAHKAQKSLKEAQALADSMKELSITLVAKTSKSGKIFGSITSEQVSEKLENMGFSVDKKKILLKNKIKKLGKYQASLLLHREIEHPINLIVIKEES